MTQQEVRELLAEAANPDCSYVRRRNILMMLELSSAAYDSKTQTFKSRGRAVGVLELLEQAFQEIVSNRPEVLEQVWPIFVMICCDRPRGELLAPVQW